MNLIKLIIWYAVKDLFYNNAIQLLSVCFVVCFLVVGWHEIEEHRKVSFETLS